MKVYLEMVGGYGWPGSDDWWMLRYEYDEEHPKTVENNGKWVRYESVCRRGTLDLSRALAFLKENPEG